MNPDPLPKSNELVRTPRKNQTSFKNKKINQQLTGLVDQENSSKQNPEPRGQSQSQLILVCALAILMIIVVIERIFTKDDMLLTLISSMFSLIVGYHFGPPKPE